MESGSLRLKAPEYGQDVSPIETNCLCSTCRDYSRSIIHMMLKEGDSLAAQLVTTHNIAYMMRLMRTMRQVGLFYRYLIISLASFNNYSMVVVVVVVVGYHGRESCLSWIHQ